MMDSVNENTTAAGAGATVNSAKVEGAEEEKIEEDELVDEIISDAVPDLSDSSQLKTPEDERIDDSSESEEKKPAAKHNNNDGAVDVINNEHMNEDTQPRNDEAGKAAPQTGTIAAIPPNNTTTYQRAVVPGVTFVPGPGYTGTGIHTGYHSGSDTDNDDANDVILQGFLPEDAPSPSTTPRISSRAERTEERVQRLIDNAITLDDSAVKPIPIEGDEEANNHHVLEGAGSDVSTEDDDAKSGKSDSYHQWLLPLMVLLIFACVILAIALPLSLRGRVTNATQDKASSLNEAACLPGGVEARFELAKSILSEITPPGLLEDESTPQGKAIRWIVCDDSISVQRLENQDASTGKLPKQKNGFQMSGDSGEAQVTRRYILAVVSYSTSQDSPWVDSLNFLSPDLHECNWHRNYTRQNYPHGDFLPVGMFCIIDKGEQSTEGYKPTGVNKIRVFDEFLLDDEHYPLKYLALSFRVDNNLNGPLPPEIGYLLDCKVLAIESNIGLTGPLPQTMGNMHRLETLGLTFSGVGGEVPSSLFSLKNLTTIQIAGNLGTNWSLPASAKVANDTGLDRLLLKGNGFTGTIPTWLGQLKRLQTLDLSENNFQGAIPDAIGDLSSIKYLNLMDNNLSETIPPSIGRLSRLIALYLGINKLQGELPPSIGNLQTLLLLDVGSNEMVSTIPSSFANLENLKFLVLESNRFNGTLDVLRSMKKLTVLSIRSNLFSGVLPDGLFSEASEDEDVAIDIGDNQLTGDLPTSFASMSNLVSLIGAKNSFVDDTIDPAVCNSTSTLVMDCNACECCGICCDGENDDVCEFQLDVRTFLDSHHGCGPWFGRCF